MCGARLPEYVREKQPEDVEGCGRNNPPGAIQKFWRVPICLRLKFAGDHTARVPPVPISNTEVKPRWADGTARVSVWEIR